MQTFPHHYCVSSTGSADGEVLTSSGDLPILNVTAPPLFDGPPGHWSPETLLLAAVSTCFVLSFRSVARASRLGWKSLSCSVEGVLDREKGMTRFTRLILSPVLVVGDGEEREKAERCLKKAEQVCLITNSLSAETSLKATVDAEIESLT